MKCHLFQFLARLRISRIVFGEFDLCRLASNIPTIFHHGAVLRGCTLHS